MKRSFKDSDGRGDRAFKPRLLEAPRAARTSAWTEEEDAHLEYLLLDLGLSNFAAGVIIGRSEAAVKRRKAIKGWGSLLPDAERLKKGHEVLRKIMKSREQKIAESSLKQELSEARAEMRNGTPLYKKGKLEY